MPMPPPTRLALALLTFGAVLGGGSDASGQSAVVAVLVDQIGPKPIRVEMSATDAGPCEERVPLYAGWLAPGRWRLDSPKRCVCWRQTYDNFPDVNWSPPRITCLPRSWRGRFCPPAAGAFISIEIRSSE
jgi:hypothetical protein